VLVLEFPPQFSSDVAAVSCGKRFRHAAGALGSANSKPGSSTPVARSIAPSAAVLRVPLDVQHQVARAGGE
jgi:hypothetical protein